MYVKNQFIMIEKIACNWFRILFAPSSKSIAQFLTRLISGRKAQQSTSWESS